ncbi:hypothetical protein [Williamsia sp. CHRR-6]|uniref:hypothetical protein n=1 Tax=Williamsia sp. CHRR-6 TaxID=2835871 RepID=UPI001BD96CB9|nr:hypothetical protein [Williamsia sp. CHRR-6]MBT0566102.1 hypothetical protein [Williamsia sp. CHRR-6]
MSELTNLRTLARAVAVVATGAALTFGMTACGAGQVSQSAGQQAAVNGTSGNAGKIALRDVHIIFPEADATNAFASGGPFELAFLISNNSPDEDDALVSITLPGGGTATITGSKELKATRSLRAGNPSLLLTTAPESSAASSPQSSTPATADSAEAPGETRIDVTISGAGNQIRPGLTVPMDFTFAKSGKVTVNVPVDAGATMERNGGSTLNPGVGEEKKESAGEGGMEMGG